LVLNLVGSSLAHYMMYSDCNFVLCIEFMCCIKETNLCLKCFATGSFISNPGSVKLETISDLYIFHKGGNWRLI
jgi:hypothetical protein